MGHCKFGLPAAAVAALIASACSTLGPNDNPAVPANYRSLIAASIAGEMDFSKFIKAEVSSPGVWEAPIGPASRPIACARITIEGTFGPHSYTLGYRFVNGRIDDVFNPDAVNPAAGGYIAAAINSAASCGKLAYGPFPELARPKQQTAKK